uniref:Translocase of outer mitochondrial membrane 20 n=1 Tax=Oryzias latipes TaxID=8090 RepID=A0A3B3IK38_ORYLA
MISGGKSAVVAGVCGAVFVAYCFYFDRKRRSDPQFKQKLRERRRKLNSSNINSGESKFPDLKDAEAVQKFFLKEIELGEELLSQGGAVAPFRCPPLTERGGI